MEYNNDELNELEYDLALQYDKRTYCIYCNSWSHSSYNVVGYPQKFPKFSQVTNDSVFLMSFVSLKKITNSLR